MRSCQGSREADLWSYRIVLGISDVLLRARNEPGCIAQERHTHRILPLRRSEAVADDQRLETDRDVAVRLSVGVSVQNPRCEDRPIMSAVGLGGEGPVKVLEDRKVFVSEQSLQDGPEDFGGLGRRADFCIAVRVAGADGLVCRRMKRSD